MATSSSHSLYLAVDPSPILAAICIGRDLYRFAPGRNYTSDVFFQGGILQPYACEGEPVDVRPTWKLIGYFNPADEGCASLENYTYAEDFCAANPSNPILEQSQAPSQAPSLEESDLPSSMPSLQPTVKESLAPSSDPSQPPTAEESDRPSSLPSLQPTLEESSAPSLGLLQSPTVEGSQLPSSTPSNSSTGDMTGSPTDIEYPMNLPCIKPGSDCTNGAGPNDDENNCMVDQVSRHGRFELISRSFPFMVEKCAHIYLNISFYRFLTLQCTDNMIANVGYERMVLRVPAEGTKPFFFGHVTNQCGV